MLSFLATILGRYEQHHAHLNSIFQFFLRHALLVLLTISVVPHPRWRLDLDLDLDLL
jgi:hypothetical protein